MLLYTFTYMGYLLLTQDYHNHESHNALSNGIDISSDQGAGFLKVVNSLVSSWECSKLLTSEHSQLDDCNFFPTRL